MSIRSNRMIPLHFLDFSTVTAGSPNRDVLYAQLLNRKAAMSFNSSIISHPTSPVAEIKSALPRIPEPNQQFHSRCHQIAYACLEPLKPAINSLINRFGASRLGVVCGTSASGNRSVEEEWQDAGNFDFDYHNLHTYGCVARYLKRASGIKGPAFSVSTACSSGSNALFSAARLIQSNVCDAVLTGAVDSLCLTTYHGFQSLQIMDSLFCRPFDANRQGVNLGEGAAFFLLSSSSIPDLPTQALLLGMGASSDAYHMTAPDPEGFGAMLAMNRALKHADLNIREMDYINLHGTGTPLNDIAEAVAVQQIFGDALPCSSTKGYTGHLLGAAAAIEIAICILSLKNGILFANHGLNDRDPSISINILPEHLKTSVHRIMKNSFAFGGNNTCVILGA